MKNVLVHRHDGGYVTALTENGKLVEYIVDNIGSSTVGNIYKGIVKNINTGFIFIDIGLPLQAFLDTSDGREAGLFRDSKLLVHRSNELIVQVLKDSRGDKGPVVTTNIAYTGRFIVLSRSDNSDSVTISRKIERTEGQRLLELVQNLLPGGFSAIIRTAAVGRQHKEIADEITHLIAHFHKHTAWEHVKAPAVLQEEPPILRTLRDVISDDTDTVLTDCSELIEQNPHFKFSYYNTQHHDQPLFEHYFLQTQISKLRDKRVWLNSGAFIVIEQTEACVVIDVNTGKASGKHNDATKLKVNIEAATEIARQLRLRNLSGIILIDFISMVSASDISSLTDHLRQKFRMDRIPTVAVGMTALGLMEVTRKRMRNAVNAH